MATERSIQEIIHSIEQGGAARIIRAAVLLALIVGLFLLYFLVQFKGLGTAEAMDQAQIARNLADGRGFSTSYIRPMAIWQLSHSDKPVPASEFPDFSNAPLFPMLNSVILPLFTDKEGKLSPTELIYPGDRVIAAVCVILFLLSVGIGYAIASRLFDSFVAFIGSAALLLSDLLWQFSLSGLPQMLLLFLFMSVSWFAIQALASLEEDKPAKSILMLAIASAFFGLMALTHGLAAFIYLGFLFYCGFFIRPRFVSILVSFIVFSAIVTPWLVRNYEVSGSPLGIAYYELLASGDIWQQMLRSLEPNVGEATYGLKAKFKNNVLDQVNNLLAYFGMCVLVAGFFVSLLHPFRSQVTASFRWGILIMWIFAVIGMGFSGVAETISANQLHVLFLPLMAYFGIAFFFVLWTRLGFTLPLMRYAFAGLLVFLTAIPALLTLFGGPQGRVHWPPYVPPFIAILGEWTAPNEIIASDIPWAVAWYAQRRALLLPDTVTAFNEISDYRLLGEKICGLYLTPESGGQPFTAIRKGPFKEWAPFILQIVNLKNFPLQYAVPLPIDGECIFITDRIRWEQRANP